MTPYSTLKVLYHNVVYIQFQMELNPGHHTIFFLVEEDFLGAVEAGVLLGRTDSGCP